MRKLKSTDKMKTDILILIGTGMLAFAVKCIYDPAQMVTGGFSGLAILIKQLTQPFIPNGAPLGLTTFLLNVPVFLAAYPLKGRGFVSRTFVATILVSLWLFILPEIRIESHDYILASVFGGVVAGAGIGMVLSTGSTTGGTDMIASLFQLRFRQYTIAQIMAILDGIIILAGGFQFGFPVALYAVVSVYISAKVSDAIVIGTHFAKSVYIVTDKPDIIADELMKKLSRGITGIPAVGMYTGATKKLLFSVVSKKEIVQLKEIVYRLDEKAFVIVSEAKEVLGEGFLGKI